MISSSLVISLLLAAQILAAAPRQQFANCLRTFVNAKLEERMAPDAFSTALASACVEQQNAYKAAYIAAATRVGDSRSMAEQDADLEIEDLRTNFRELFQNAQPE